MWDDKRGLKEPLLRQEGQHGKKLEDNSEFRGINEEGRSFHDIFFGIIFLMMVAGSVAISVVAFTQGDPKTLVPSSDYTNDAEVQTNYWFQDSVARMKADIKIIAGATALAIILGFAWVQLLKTFTKLFIYLTLFVGIALIVAVGIYLLVIGSEKNNSHLRIVSYCIFVVAALFVIVIIYLRSRIALTCELFKETCLGIQYNPSVFLVAAIIIGVFILFVAYWMASFIYLYSIPSGSKIVIPHTPPQFNQSVRNLMYYQIFAFLWVTSFLSAVFQVSVAGGIATWYFSRDVNGFGRDVGSPTMRSFSRALTKSFGSLALGSLIIATVRFINFLLRVTKKKNQTKNPIITFIVNCVICIFGCIQRIIQFINRYAYIYIAMHGDGFCTSAKNCFDLVSRNFFSAAIVDMLGEFVLFVGRLLGTAACTLFTIAVVQGFGRTISTVTIVMVVVISFVIFTIYAHIIGVGVDTVMVCYLEDMERNSDDALYISPVLHKMLQDKNSKEKRTAIQN